MYKIELYEPFIAALKLVTNNNSVIFIGLTRHFCKPLFFEKLHINGFVYTFLPQEACPTEYGNESTGRDVGVLMCFNKYGVI